VAASWALLLAELDKIVPKEIPKDLIVKDGSGEKVENKTVENGEILKEIENSDENKKNSEDDKKIEETSTESFTESLANEGLLFGIFLII